MRTPEAVIVAQPNCIPSDPEFPSGAHELVPDPNAVLPFGVVARAFTLNGAGVPVHESLLYAETVGSPLAVTETPNDMEPAIGVAKAAEGMMSSRPRAVVVVLFFIFGVCCGMNLVERFIIKHLLCPKIQLRSIVAAARF